MESFVVKNMPLHVSPHLRPNEVISENLLYFLDSKMADKSTCMNFLHKQNANRTIWNAAKQKSIMQIKFRIPCHHNTCNIVQQKMN